MSDNEIDPAAKPPEPPVGPWSGPLDVLIELHGSMAARNAVVHTVENYDGPMPEGTPAAARPAPLGAPIDAGRAIPFDAKRFVIDRDILRRVRRRRRD